MKLTLVLFSAATMFLTSCGNNSESSLTKTDTSVASNDSSSEQTSTPSDTTKSGDELMKAMNDMMAKMDIMQMSGSFDVDFATMMITHHQAAIDMAQVEISKGADQKIKLMAQNIIIKQTEEQGKLKDILKPFRTEQPKSDSTHEEHRLHDVMINMMDKMKGMQMTGNTDKDFVKMMIPHHESAISMAKNELEFGKNSQLKQMAQKSNADQQKDIKEFQSWLSANK